ncbi:hypothetical protein GJ744_005966 [Endocarpon pusillum]|uniref:Protein kinase domain-containing protein n=1 Tax=Endocarpon pusillum TaxID=364733 RepID=A0A8H7A588_9EURO|nr:hypothetical protein GJ744_005966 [Endocarpon pusillum]
MSSSGSGATWLSLLDKKRHIKESLPRVYAALGDVNSGPSFRAAFENLCKKVKEHKIYSLEAKLLPSFKAITELARAADQSVADQSAARLPHLQPNDTLEGLVWWTSFTLIKCGFRAGVGLGALVTLTAELNKSVPSFSTNAGEFTLRFPNQNRVQKHLQEVYSLFIDEQLFIISYLNRKDPAPNLNVTSEKVLGDHLAETVRQFEKARGLYNVILSQATEDEEREKKELDRPNVDSQRPLSELLHRNSASRSKVSVQFTSTRPLGFGSYGEVDEVQESSTGASYARKRIHLDTNKPSDVIAKEVKNEVAIMQKLRHLHIATVLFYLRDGDGYSIFMLPVADYDLWKFMGHCSRQDFPPSLTKQIYPWFGCLLDALAYAHKLEIKHQDIKPSNILIKNNQPYLSDFGLAKDFAEIHMSTSHGDKVQGTPVYRAPEVLPNQQRGRRADVFALGCVYSEMFSITQEKSLEEYRAARQEADSIAFRDCLPKVKKWLKVFEKEKLSRVLVDQILSMMERNVDERPTAEKALNFLKREPALFCVE